jgi:phosphoserine phosphatase
MAIVLLRSLVDIGHPRLHILLAVFRSHPNQAEHLSKMLKYSQSEARLAELARRTDLVVVDLDKCLFPGYSQTALGTTILWRVLVSPLSAGDRKYLVRLLSGALYVAASKVRRPPNRQLIDAYERAMRGIPEQYFLDGASLLPRFSRRGAREVVRFLSRHAPVGLVSLGIDVVAREFMKQVPGLSFYRCNRLRFRQDQPHRPFVGYEGERMCDGVAKMRVLRALCVMSRARCPLVIGHDVDDVAMAASARELGGWSIGIRPPRALRSWFDARTTGADWTPLLSLWA